jgi:hypothetical protein
MLRSLLEKVSEFLQGIVIPAGNDLDTAIIKVHGMT